MDGAIAAQVAEFAEALTEVWSKTSHSVVSSVAALMVLQGAPDEAKEGAAWCLRTLSQVCVCAGVEALSAWCSVLHGQIMLPIRPVFVLLFVLVYACVPDARVASAAAVDA